MATFWLAKLAGTTVELMREHAIILFFVMCDPFSTDVLGPNKEDKNSFEMKLFNIANSNRNEDAKKLNSYLHNLQQLQYTKLGFHFSIS